MYLCIYIACGQLEKLVCYSKSAENVIGLNCGRPGHVHLKQIVKPYLGSVWGAGHDGGDTVVKEPLSNVNRCTHSA